MHRSLRIVFLLVFFPLCQLLHAQNTPVDSLVKAAAGMPDDTNKVKAFNEISWTVLFQSRYPEAREYANKALALSEKLHYPIGAVKAITRLGLADSEEGKQHEALKHHFHALEVSEENDLTIGKNIAYNNIGNVYYSLRTFPRALDYHLKALRTAENLKDSTTIAKSYNNIGNVYYSMKDYDKALEYYLTSSHIRGKYVSGEMRASLMANIGQVYMHQNKIGEALEYMREGLRIREEMGYPVGINNSLNNIGLVYFYAKDYDKAIEYYNKALELNKEIGNMEGVEMVHFNLANTYKEMGKYQEAIDHGITSKDMCVSLGLTQNVAQSYGQLADIYSLAGKYDDAVKYYKAYNAIRDSLDNEGKSREINDKEDQYKFEREMERKQMEQEKEHAVATEMLKRQKLTIWWVASGGLLLLVLGAVVLRAYSRKRKDNVTLAHQKAQIEEKHREIKDSINYAKRIQTAILPSHKTLRDIFPDSFILFKPKAVVSGDFYWFYETPGKVIWTVADCTGHGVPGAFMSMIGNAFLNEIVIEGKITDPGAILDRLREKVIRALEQQRMETQQKDGMDIALCVLDKQTRELQFAGAHNPLWIIRAGDSSLVEIKGDKMPIGVYEAVQKPFNVQTTFVGEGDSVYLFSDGYADQFGGPKGKKFKYSQVKELLLSFHKQRMEQQHTILDETFEMWRGDLEQIDDVCVLGVRI